MLLKHPLHVMPGAALPRASKRSAGMRLALLTWMVPPAMFHRFTVVFILALGALTACESRQAGEACWSDFECQSNSCTFGTCDSDLVGLLGFAADVFGESQPPATYAPSETPASAYSVCSGLSAAACTPARGCSLDEYCIPPFTCGYGADAGNDCFECLYTAGCPAPCLSVPYCR